jgi:hypothetical protein
MSLVARLFAGCFLIATLIAPASASVIYDLALTPTSGSISGTGVLTLDTPVSSSGQVDVSLSDVTSITFNIGGENFGTNYSTYSLLAVQFLNGSIRDITFSSAVNGNEISLMTTGGYVFTDQVNSTRSLGTITSELVPGVPEPATWAMMILGFCGVGAMTYRRRKTAALAG